MIPDRRSVALLACITVGIFAEACQESPAPPPAADGAMPRDPRGEIKEARFQEAIRGLDFETGLVVVKEPLAGDRDLALEHQALGLEALAGNRFTGAIKALAHAVRTDPQLAEAHHDLGRALAAKGKTEYAIAAFRTALALEPEPIETRFNLAAALARLGREPEAIDEMQAVIERDPQNAVALERMAVWHYYTGDHAGAWAHVHAARVLGRPLPPQFLALLEAQMPDPG